MEQKLLLLSCCAPCSVGVIHRLKQAGVQFTVLFYNPNIRPFEEYQKRCQENKRICLEENIPFVELEYNTTLWNQECGHLMNEPERGKRCQICFYLRLKRTAEYAKQNGFTHFTSVLGISRFKDFNQVCSVAQEISQLYQIPYDMTNWRKNGGLELAEKLGKEKQLYRQSYCGCKPRSI
ncbi:MAG: epoxyqueuosine reductase QueH [Alphaproteobacteria bacterium]|nr:epoxyqueuosine reductase QueH [Alphaproteobacteria bacterium]